MVRRPSARFWNTAVPSPAYASATSISDTTGHSSHNAVPRSRTTGTSSTAASRYSAANRHRLACRAMRQARSGGVPCSGHSHTHSQPASSPVGMSMK